MIFPVLSFAVCLLTAPAVPPRPSTWIVDAQFGPGAQFRTIQAAIDAAADGDTILVRDGTYTESLRVDGKGLQLRGLGAAFLLAPPASASSPLLELRNLPAGSEFTLRTFDLARITGRAGGAIVLVDNAGRIEIEEVFVDSYDGHALAVENCAELVLVEVRGQANLAWRDANGDHAAAGLHVTRGSHVWCYTSWFRGSHSGPFLAVLFAPTPGGEGLVLRDSTIELVDVELDGGSGASTLVGACVLGAIGGAALHVTAPLGLPTRAIVRGGARDAGPTGTFDPHCTSHPGQAPAIFDPLGVVTVRGGEPRLLAWPTLPYPNGAFEWRLRARPFDAFAIVVAPTGTSPLAVPGIDGVLLLSPTTLVVAWSGVTDASGWTGAALRVALPNGPHTLRAQALCIDRSGGVELSNPGSLLVR